MTATLYVHVGDGELRAEDAGTAVRIVAGNFEWTMLLENRLDCARWAKVIADADALFIRRKLPLPEVAAGPEPGLELEVNEAGYPAGNYMSPAEDPLAEYQALSNELHYSEQDRACAFCGEKPGDGVALLWAQDRWQCSDADACRERCIAQEGTDPCEDELPQREPGGPPAHPWQAAMDAQLSPEALAGGVPLGQLAADAEEGDD